ncbi:hypothetical protein GUJ93_ZPchr0015g6611 [Zizania palustris]|uniref:Uncharacterized protein n=1 Tax=Zizania palustris TaxID=103762 RepID=A0A8J5TDC6_ZIZPA|nr:hypothetical protein GUJ93_ZPchr0015g6611 [Zizania palustris]
MKGEHRSWSSKVGPVRAAVRTQWFAGMRFKMAFEMRTRRGSAGSWGQFRPCSPLTPLDGLIHHGDCSRCLGMDRTCCRMSRAHGVGPLGYFPDGTLAVIQKQGMLNLISLGFTLMAVKKSPSDEEAVKKSTSDASSPRSNHNSTAYDVSCGGAPLCQGYKVLDVGLETGHYKVPCQQNVELLCTSHNIN